MGIVDTRTPYEQWDDGGGDATHALHSLLSDINEIDSDLKPLTADKEIKREQLGAIIRSIGPQTVGDQELRWQEAVLTESYDTKQLDAILSELATAGHLDIVSKLANCKKPGTRSAHLRIERIRKGEKE